MCVLFLVGSLNLATFNAMIVKIIKAVFSHPHVVKDHMEIGGLYGFNQLFCDGSLSCRVLINDVWRWSSVFLPYRVFPQMSTILSIRFQLNDKWNGRFFVFLLLHFWEEEWEKLNLTQLIFKQGTGGSHCQPICPIFGRPAAPTSTPPPS